MKPFPRPRTLKNEELADLYGSISAKKAELEAQLETLQTDFLRRKYAVIDGRRYRLSRVEACSYPVLNAELIRQMMDSDWVERMSKTAQRGAYCLVKAITKKRVGTPRKISASEPARELATVG